MTETKRTRKEPAREPDGIVAVDRVLPHNLEAEKSVLGAILIDNGYLHQALELLRPAMFFRDAHRRIFAAMVELEDHKSAVDFTTLKNELQRKAELDEVGGPAYISALVDGLPHAVNLKYYAGIVREKYLLREIIFASNKALSSAYEAELSSVDILKSTDTALLDIQREGDRRGFVTLDRQAHELFADLEWRVENKGKLLGVDSGFRSINDQTQGFQRGDMIVLAARPSIGKTALALNFAVAAARAGEHVAIFSLEMRRRQLEYRMLSAMSGVLATRLLTGYLTEEDYKNISEALNTFAELPIYINDRARQTVADIRISCRRLKNEKGLGLVIIDYVQLMQGSLERRGATRNEEITDISRRLKVLADELGVPMMVLSQLKRTGGARPTLEDLRESGSLEQDADLACLLHRKNHKESGTTNFMLEKQRNGPTGTINLLFDRDRQRFEDAGEPTEEEQHQAETEDEKHRKTRAIIRARARGK